MGMDWRRRMVGSLELDWRGRRSDGMRIGERRVT